MHRRLQAFLPIVLLALSIQVLAPVAACWATANAILDPVGTESICHADAANGAGDASHHNLPHGELCALCVFHAGTSVAPTGAAAIVAHPGQILIVAWPEAPG